MTKKTIVILNNVFNDTSMIMIEEENGLYVVEHDKNFKVSDLNEIANDMDIDINDYKLVATRDNVKGELEIESFEE